MESKDLGTMCVGRCRCFVGMPCLTRVGGVEVFVRVAEEIRAVVGEFVVVECKDSFARE
jgi:hypothetical protein